MTIWIARNGRKRKDSDGSEKDKREEHLIWTATSLFTGKRFPRRLHKGASPGPPRAIPHRFTATSRKEKLLNQIVTRSFDLHDEAKKRREWDLIHLQIR